MYFFDVHFNNSEETRCQQPSHNIVKYLHQNFLKINHTVDFFMEIHSDRIIGYRHVTYYRSRYIDKVKQLFSDTFQFSEINNKVLKNKLYSNDRFHFMDIRSFFIH